MHGINLNIYACILIFNHVNIFLLINKEIFNSTSLKNLYFSLKNRRNFALYTHKKYPVLKIMLLIAAVFFFIISTQMILYVNLSVILNFLISFERFT